MTCSLNKNQFDSLKKSILNNLEQIKDLKPALKSSIEELIYTLIKDSTVSTNDLFGLVNSAIDKLDNILLDTEYNSEWGIIKYSSKDIILNVLNYNGILKSLDINFLNFPKFEFNILGASDLKTSLSLKTKEVEDVLIKINDKKSITVSKVDGKITERISKIANANSVIPSNVVSLNKGNIIDFVFKKFLSLKYNSYNELLTSLKSDPYILKNKFFSNYSIKNNSTTEENIFGNDDNLNTVLLTTIIEAIKFVSSLNDEWDIIIGDDISNGSKQLFVGGARGVFDLLLKNKKNNSLKVIDIKSTSNAINTQVSDEYKNQVNLYEYILDNILDKTYKFESPVVYTIQINNINGVINSARLETESYNEKEITDKINSVINGIIKETLPVIKTSKDYPLNHGPRNYIKFQLNSLKRKIDPSLDQVLKSSDPINTPITLMGELAILNKRFPEFAKNDRIVSAIENGVGGRFFAHAIFLSENSNVGVANHESWHRFSQLYLTKEEKIKLYNFVRQKAIPFKSRDTGENLNTFSAPLLEIEEFLAEEFKDYAKYPNSYSFPGDEKEEVKSIFKKILDFLKSILGLSKDDKIDILKMFSDLNLGTFDRSNFSLENIIFDSVNSKFIDKNTKLELLSNHRTQTISKLISESIANELTRTNKYIFEYLLDKGLKTNFKNLVHDHILLYIEQLKSIPEDNLVIIKNTKDEELLNNLLIIEDNFDNYFYNCFLVETNFKAVKNIVRLYEEENSGKVNSSSIEDLENENFILFKDDKEVELSELLSGSAHDFLYGIPHYKDGYTISYRSLSENYNNLDKIIDFNKDVIPPLSLYQSLNSLFFGQLNDEKFNEIMRSSNEKLLQLPLIYYKFENLKYRIRTEQNPEIKIYLLQLYSEFKELLTLNKFTLLDQHIDVSPKSKDSAFKNSRIISLTPSNIQHAFTKFLHSFQKLKNENTIDAYDYLKSFLVSNFFDMFGKETSEFFKLDEFSQKYLTKIKNLVPKYDSLGNKDLYNEVLGLRSYNTSLNKPIDKMANPFSITESKRFLASLGIVLSKSIPENVYAEDIHPKVAELSTIFTYLQNKEGFAYEYLNLNDDNVNNIYNSKLKIGRLLTAFSTLDDSNSGADEIIQAQRYINSQLFDLFSTSPLDSIISYSSNRQTLTEKKNSKYSIAAPIVMAIAEINERYTDSIKTPSVETSGVTINTLSKPSQLSLKANLLNSGYVGPETNYLNFEINPHMRYSLISQTIKNNGQIHIDKLVSTSLRTKDNEKIESNLIKTLNANELIVNRFIDFTVNDRLDKGYNGIILHNMEASDSVYRMSLSSDKESSNSRKGDIKFHLPSSSSVEEISPEALKQIFNYFKYSTVQYLEFYNKRKNTNEEPGEYEKIGIFESMLKDNDLSGNEGKKLLEEWKNLIKDIDFDSNTANNIDRIESENLDLVLKIKNIFKNYLRNSAISYIKFLNETKGELTSEHLKTIITSFFGMTVDPFGIPVSQTQDAINSMQVRVAINFVVADFISAFEESIHFFGDLTYFKDPSKRRKTLVNTGTTAHLDEFLREQFRDLNNNSISVSSKNRILSLLKQKPQQPKDLNTLRFSILSSKKVKPNIESNKKLFKKLYGENNPDFEKASLFEKEKHPMDSDGLMTLDLLKRMFLKSNKWSDDMEKEYQRQAAFARVWIEKRFNPLFKNLTKDEFLNIIFSEKKYSSLKGDYINSILTDHYFTFVKQKMATTGHLLENTIHSIKPLFFKPAFNIFLPTVMLSLDKLGEEADKFNRLYEEMLINEIDYVLDKEGSKAYSPIEAETDFDKTGHNLVLKYGEHSAIWFKEQINQVKSSKLSLLVTQRLSQLSNLLVNIPITPENASYRESLQKDLDSIKENIQLILESNIETLKSKLGLEYDKSKDKWSFSDEGKFRRYLTQRLRNSEKVTISDIENVLQETKYGYSYDLTFLLSNSAIGDIIMGLLDDYYRNFRTPGVFYNNSALGMLNYFSIPDLKGNIVKSDQSKIEHAECVMSFSKKYHEPLFNLTFRLKSGKITTIKKEYPNYSINEKIDILNELLDNSEFVNRHIESLEFTFSRIPFSNINFNGHGKLRKLLYPELGNIIIVPLENGIRVGLDMDNDKMPIQLKTLDSLTGKPYKVGKEKSIETLKREFLKVDEDLRIYRKEKPRDTELDDKLNAALLDNEYFQSLSKELDKILEESNINMDGYSVNVYKESLSFEIDEENPLYEMFNGLHRLKSIGTIKLQNSIENSEIIEILEEIKYVFDQIKEDLNIEGSEIERMAKEARYNYYNYTSSRYNEMLASEISMLSNPYSVNFTLMTDSLDELNKRIMNLETLIKDPKLTNALNILKTSKLIPHHKMISIMDDIRNIYNNRDRKNLGPIIKFISWLSQAAEKEIKINKTFYTQSKTKINKHIINPKDENYQLTPVELPELFGKIPDKFSLRDSKGNLITLLLSDMASSYLDLFKNEYTSKNTGASYHNMKIFLAMYSLQLDESTIHTFFRSPIVQAMTENARNNQKEFKNQLRFTLSSIGESLFSKNDNPLDRGSEKPKLTRIDGELNIKMSDPIGDISMNYQALKNKIPDILLKILGRSDGTIAEAVQKMTREYNDRYGGNKNYQVDLSALSNFLNLEENKAYKDLSLLLYDFYGIMHRWGNDLYNLYVVDNPLSTKISDINLIYNRIKNDKIKAALNLVSEPENKKSIADLFKRDNEIESLVYKVLYPKFLNESKFEDKIFNKINEITNSVYVDIDEKRNFVNNVLAEFREYLYKNYYFHNFNYNNIPVANNFSTIPYHFEDEIFRNNVDEGEKLNDTVENFYRLIDKYSFLKKLDFISAINSSEIYGFTNFNTPSTSNFDETFEGILDKKNKSKIKILKINVARGTASRNREAESFKDTFERLINFNPFDFISYIDKKDMNFYNQDEVKKEIREFFDLFQYYALNLSNPYRTISGSIAEFVPQQTISKILDSAIENFANQNAQQINEALADFERKFYMFNSRNISILDDSKRVNMTFDKQGFVKPYELSVKAKEKMTKNTFTITPKGMFPINLSC